MAQTRQQIPLYGGLYLYELPNQPKHEDILYHDLPKAEQYWRTPAIPSDFEWKRMDKQSQYDIVKMHRDRWENGLWYYNNGIPTYITGMHYDHLTFMTFDFGKANYYDSQRLDFYFRDYTRKDPFCFGRNWLKPRRYGMTLEEITEQTYTSMERENSLQGMISDNMEKTRDTIFTPLVMSLLKRPKFTRPKIYTPNGKIPKRELRFNDGLVNSDFEDSMGFSNGCLNSFIKPKPTTVIGYDGWKLHYLTLDEVWKWIGANPAACYEKQKKCFTVGGKIIGKCSVLSTMGDDDSYAKAIEAGLKMWYDSDPRKRDHNGYTTSGLYRYFVSAIYAMFEYADIYGFIDAKRAKQHILNDRAKYAPGTKEYLYECRRMPITEEEALATANMTAVFDPKRVQSAITFLEGLTPDKQPSFFANLEEDQHGHIHIEKKSWGDGNFQLANLPKMEGEKDFSNRWYKDESGQIQLFPNMQGCIGYDPVRFAETDTTSDNISMAAAIARQKFDYFGNRGANKWNALYHQRPGETNDAHYEIYKLSKLLGYPVMYERNVQGFKDKMTEWGMQSAVMKSPYDGIHGIYTAKGKVVVKDGIDLLHSYWRAPTSIYELEHADYLQMTPFLDLLQQAKVFNMAKTHIFDVMMATVMMEIGLKTIKETNITDDYVNRQNNLLKVLFPTRQDMPAVTDYSTVNRYSK